MDMACSGMDNRIRTATGDVSAKPLEPISGRQGGKLGKCSFGTLYRTIMLRNVPVDVVEGARVKSVLGCPIVRPGPREHGTRKGLTRLPGVDGK